MFKQPSLATYYLLPMIDLSKSSFGDEGDIDKRTGRLTITEKSNFVDCYLSTENYIVVKVRDYDKVPSKTLATHNYFSDLMVSVEGIPYSLILFRVDKPYLEDLAKFRQGKYSRMRDIAKDKIIIFNGWDNKTDKLHQPLYGALYRSPRMREDIEIKVGIILSPEDEVLSSPKDDSFIDLSNTYKELQVIPE